MVFALALALALGIVVCKRRSIVSPTSPTFSFNQSLQGATDCLLLAELSAFESNPSQTKHTYCTKEVRDKLLTLFYVVSRRPSQSRAMADEGTGAGEAQPSQASAAGQHNTSSSKKSEYTPSPKKWLVRFTILATVCLVIMLVYGVVVNVAARKSPFDEFCWAGGVTSTSAAFRSRAPPGTTRRFVVADTSALDAGIVLSQTLEFPSGVDVAVHSVNVTGLTPNTKYYYGQLGDDNTILSSGQFSTPTAEGTPFNFTIVTAGCILSGSSGAFSEIANQDPPFMMLHAGDLHYEDPGAASVDQRVDDISLAWANEDQRQVFQSAAIGYMWDDHDYCGNNRNSDCDGRESARKAYQKAVPHYPLAGASSDINAGAGELLDVAPYQAFTIGTVRFILSDLRSEAVLSTSTSRGSIYSDEQKDWLFDELSNASAYDFVVWLSSRPWTGNESRGEDTWQGFAADREELSDHIAATIGAGKRNLFVVSSDAHMVAYDDGRNTDFSSNSNAAGGGAGFPLLQSGPLYNIGSTKGGAMSEGCFTTLFEMNSQYSTLEFLFNGSSPCIKVRSYRTHEQGPSDLLISQDLCGDLFYNDSMPEKTSSCDAPLLHTGTLVLLIVAVVVGFIAFIVLAAIGCSVACCELAELTAVATVFGGVVLLIGVVIPAGLGLTANGYFYFHLSPTFGAMLAIAVAYTVCTALHIWEVKSQKAVVKDTTELEMVTREPAASKLEEPEPTAGTSTDNEASGAGTKAGSEANAEADPEAGEGTVETRPTEPSEATDQNGAGDCDEPKPEPGSAGGVIGTAEQTTA